MSMTRTIKTKAAKALPKIVQHIPADAKAGFADGRRAGCKFVECDAPYALGAGVGFGFGVTEGVVGLLATPAKALFSLGVGLGMRMVRALGNGSRFDNESEVEVA